MPAAEGVDDARKAFDEQPGWMRQDCQAEVEPLVLYQQDMTARLAAEGVQVSARMGDGFPAEVILNLSDEVKADLIMRATHGRTGFQRSRLGSVALEVVEPATRPVFLVRVRQG